MPRTSRGSVPWLGGMPSSPLALCLFIVAAVLLSAAVSTVDASPRYPSRMRGSFQQGDQKGQRTTRGFKNLELSVARGFGKRSGEDSAVGAGAGEESQRAPHALLQAAPGRLRWFSGGQQENGEDSEALEGEARKDIINPYPWQFGPGSRFPDQWLADEVAGNPGLAQVLVRRFVDEDGDGEVTAEEMLRPFSS
ncbi:allatotropins-like [Ischnura elegans]|uniref:allatotropins-like n=1 Tax=Ischnura elegans TaxID=197161 RepID=UPI001ED8B62D|nr:allatotropins-like [Ischnura elegans]